MKFTTGPWSTNWLFQIKINQGKYGSIQRSDFGAQVSTTVDRDAAIISY